LAEAHAKLADELLKTAPTPEAGPEGDDRLLLAKEAAKLLGIGESTLQLHAQDYSFTRKLPGGRKRFSLQGIQAFLRGAQQSA
jgi:hypothetical protein